MITVVGGVILAYIIKDARFAEDKITEPTDEIVIQTNTPPQPPLNRNPQIPNESSQDSIFWSGLLSARIPTLNEIRTEIPVSLWDANLLDIPDMNEPGIKKFKGEVDEGKEYLLPTYWCSKSSEVLNQNINKIKTSFSVNDETIPQENIFNYKFDTNNGWKCNYHSVILGDWEKGVSYTIDVKRTIIEKISDGQTSYSPGDYIYRITIYVR